MQLQFSNLQAIMLLMDNKLITKQLNISITINCNCSDENLLQEEKIKFEDSFDFSGYIFVNKDDSYDLLLPLEENKMVEIMVVEDIGDLITPIFALVNTHFQKTTSVNLSGLSINIE